MPGVRREAFTPIMNQPLRADGGTWFSRLWQECQGCLHDNLDVLLGNLSRATNLLIILNVSLFFLTGRVGGGGYTWPVCSLGILGLLQLLLILPMGLSRRLGFYLGLVALWCAAAFLFVGSVLYLLNHYEP